MGHQLPEYIGWPSSSAPDPRRSLIFLTKWHLALALPPGALLISTTHVTFNARLPRLCHLLYFSLFSQKQLLQDMNHVLCFFPPQNYLTHLNTMSMLNFEEKVSVTCVLIAQMLGLKKVDGTNIKYSGWKRLYGHYYLISKICIWKNGDQERVMSLFSRHKV